MKSKKAKHRRLSPVILIVFSFFILVKVVAGVSVGTEILNGGIEVPANSKPYVWSCGEKIVLEDCVEEGRVSDCSEKLIERWNNYLFEGEQLKFDVLALDIDGIDKIYNVYVTVGNEPVSGNKIEVRCEPMGTPIEDISACSARIGEYNITEFNPEIMGHYECLFTVETPDSMYGQSWIMIEAQDTNGSIGLLNPQENWYLNPIIGLSVINNENLFEDLKPGEISYSDNIHIGNAADEGSGVLMDIFISGTDFHDNSEEPTFCPDEGVLNLSRFSYFAKNGEYDTLGLPDSDNEGYRPINYSDSFTRDFYNSSDVIPKAPLDPPFNSYYQANILQPEEEIELKLKLDIPEFCKGNFNSGVIYFWAEAI